MRTVVVDTSTILPALLSPQGRRRKLLTVLAYGGIVAYSRIGGAELDVMRTLTEENDGAVIDGLPIELLVDHARDAHTQMEEHLPAVTPNDFVMASSPLLFDEIKRKISQIGHIWNVSPDGARTYRRALLAVTPIIVPLCENFGGPRLRARRSGGQLPRPHCHRRAGRVPDLRRQEGRARRGQRGDPLSAHRAARHGDPGERLHRGAPEHLQLRRRRRARRAPAVRLPLHAEPGVLQAAGRDALGLLAPGPSLGAIGVPCRP